MFTVVLRYFNAPILLVSGFLLVACGGGGGGSDGGGGVNTSITVSSSSLDFRVRVGTNQSQDVTVNFVGDGVVIGTPPSDPVLPSWLNASVVGSQSNSPLTVSVTVTPGVTGYPGTPGTYTATLRFLTGRVDGSNISYVDVPVTFDLYSPVNVDTTPQTAMLYKNASTGVNAGAFTVYTGNDLWTAQSNQAWLQLSQASGKYSTQVNYSIDVDQLSIGTSSAVVTVHDDYENIDHLIQVSVYIQPNKLSASQKNVAFSSFPSRGQLNKIVQVGDLSAGTVQWQASTTSSWLFLTQSSTTTPANLTISADQTGLAPGMYYATINLSSTDSSISSSESINVGFYVSDADPSSTASTSLPAIPVNTVHDALGPYVYISYGTNDIEIYNSYTGVLLDTITFPVGTEQITSMTVSDDGESLFAYNAADQTIIKYGLRTSTILDTFVNAGAVLTDLHFTRVQGYPLLLLSNGSILDPETGSNYANFTGQEYIAVKNNHNRFIASHYGFNNGHTLNQINLYAIPDVNISVSEIDSVVYNDTRRRCDDAAGPSGSTFYTVCDTDSFLNSYIIEYNDSTAIPQRIINLGETSSNPADNIEILSDTLALVGMNTRTSPRTTEISLFDLTNQQHTPLVIDATAQNLFLLWREMRISSDGRRLTGIHYQISPDSNVISFTDLP